MGVECGAGPRRTLGKSHRHARSAADDLSARKWCRPGLGGDGREQLSGVDDVLHREGHVELPDRRQDFEVRKARDAPLHLFRTRGDRLHPSSSWTPGREPALPRVWALPPPVARADRIRVDSRNEHAQRSISLPAPTKQCRGVPRSGSGPRGRARRRSRGRGGGSGLFAPPTEPPTASRTTAASEPWCWPGSRRPSPPAERRSSARCVTARTSSGNSRRPSTW